MQSVSNHSEILQYVAVLLISLLFSCVLGNVCVVFLFLISFGVLVVSELLSF